MSDITIQIRLFGGFRKFGESLDLCVPAGSNIAMVKSALQDKLNGAALILDSALANDNAILRDHDILNDDCVLSILPPVCGG